MKTRRGRCFTSLLMAALVALAPAARAADADREYMVKAAFIYNFVKFVEWPGAKAIAHTGNVNICVLGTNPFGNSLSQVMQRATSNTLKLNVFEFPAWSDELEKCHIMFISQSMRDQMVPIVKALSAHPVLTVSDIEGFSRSGGIIEFTNRDKKVKLMVNINTSRAAGLRIDAQLLEIALEVITQ